MSAAVPLPLPRPPARLLKCSDAEYYADPCAVPSLSKSVAHVLLSKSELHAWSVHPRLGSNRMKSTPVMDDGRILHKLLLGAGGEDLEVVECKEYRSNADKAIRDRVIASGKTPVKRDHYTELAEAAEIMRDRLALAGFPLTGQSELGCEWTERIPTGDVLCRCRWDHAFLDDGVIFDVKSTEDASPAKIERRAVEELGMDIQQAAYTDALEALRPEYIGRVKFLFLFVETVPPYCVTPYELSAADREMGAHRWLRALTKWHECLSTGKWPDYRGGARTIVLRSPDYILRKHHPNFHPDFYTR